MGKVIDLTGKRFGRLAVTGFSHQVGSRYYWHCTCDCGEAAAIWGADLKRGNTESCGCLAKEKRAARMTTHGMNKHAAYRSWMHMRRRCSEPTDDGYALYGGRGITVCPEWDASFAAFWSDMGDTWKPRLSIERKDVNGNYEPGNCVWATPMEQARNRRSNRIIKTPWGEMTVTEAAERSGVDPRTVFTRIRAGWPQDQLLRPAGSLGEFDTYLMWCSFADPEKAPGTQFLGVAIVDADEVVAAASEAWRLGINPGGEMIASFIPDHCVPPEFRNRLLPKEEAWPLMKAIDAMLSAAEPEDPGDVI